MTGARGAGTIAAAPRLARPHRATATVVRQQFAGLIATVIHHRALVLTRTRRTSLEVQVEQLGLLAARVRTLLAEYTVLKTNS